MNFRDLHYLVAVAEYKHFGRAAQSCFVSQPTLSAQLKKLETCLGIQLVERTQRQVMLTTIGEEIVQQAKFVLRDVQHIQDLAKQAQAPDSMTIHIGTIPTLGSTFIHESMNELRSFLPKAQIKWFEGSNETILQQLQEGKVDIAIGSLGANDEKLAVETLSKEPFKVILPGDHVLKYKGELSQTDFNNEKILLQTGETELSARVLDFFKDNPAQVSFDYCSQTVDTLQDMVGFGAGISLLPVSLLKNNMSQSTCIIKNINGTRPYRNITMTWRKYSAKKTLIIECCEKLKSLSLFGASERNSLRA